MPTPHSRRAVVREALLWAGAAIGALSATAAIAGIALGITPVIFTSGSMSPAISAGAVALTQETAIADVSEQDVISFIRSDGARVTHRVTAVASTPDGTPVLTTKGDANDTADAEPVTTATVDRVFWSVPELGFWVTEALKTPYTFAGGVLIGMIALAGFRSGSVRGRAESDDADDSETDIEPGADADPLDAEGIPLPGSRASVRRARIRARRKKLLVGTTAGSAALAVMIGSAAMPMSTLASFSDQGAATSTFSMIDGPSLQPAGSYPVSVFVVRPDQIPACTTQVSGRNRLVTATWGYRSEVVPTHYIVDLVQRDGSYSTSQQVTARSATFTIPLTAARYGKYDIVIIAENGTASSAPVYLELDNLDEFWAGCNFIEPQPVVPGAATLPTCTAAPDTATYRDVTFSMTPAGGVQAARYDVKVFGNRGFTVTASSRNPSVTVRVPLPSTGQTTYGNLPVLIQSVGLNSAGDKYAASTMHAILQFESYTGCYGVV